MDETLIPDERAKIKPKEYIQAKLMGIIPNHPVSLHLIRFTREKPQKPKISRFSKGYQGKSE